MEDEESKIRRNFLAMSVLIVLAWWLQAPLDKMTEKLLGMNSVGPDFEWRAWAAATAALCYFALRFRFSKEHDTAMNDMRAEAAKVRQSRLLRWLNWEAACFVRWGWTPPVFGSSFATVVGASRPELVTGRLPIFRIKVSELQLGRQTETGSMVMPEAGELFGSVRLTIDRHQGSASESRTIDAIGIDLTRAQRVVLNGWTYGWLALYSKASTSLLVPWIAGLLALAVCCRKRFETW
ncbi:hypothetical protein [Variovorax boronicumulans]|uniref:hypothetical protein n=1 Tax=Variovorax boronicumulans TaxID=436515 RepID=UPI002780FA86|nr:hypothetical protein [Variovorax boronicumulans]MDQ0042805.1 hypothetical protein [Variovorax boronicumulans]